jgi:hypothetical protein
VSLFRIICSVILLFPPLCQEQNAGSWRWFGTVLPFLTCRSAMPKHVGMNKEGVRTEQLQRAARKEQSLWFGNRPFSSITGEEGRHIGTEKGKDGKMERTTSEPKGKVPTVFVQLSEDSRAVPNGPLSSVRLERVSRCTPSSTARTRSD